MPDTERLLCWVTGITVVALVASVWVPEIAHYHVDVSAPPENLVEQLRSMPHDDVLEEPAVVEPFFGSPVPDHWDLAGSTDALIENYLQAAGLRLAAKDVGELDDEALETGLSSLAFASLAIPDIYTRAYEVTGQSEFLHMAERFLLRFSRYERSRWLPVGFLWNDHATAARIGVVARFWRSYRDSDIYEPSVAREVVWHAMRCAALLSDPDQFTFATNHGVMQNLALLQFAAAFPGTPEATYGAQLAVSRLALQFAFYVSPEGAVLEHSAGYHAAGVKFLRMAIELAELNRLEVPPEWPTKHRKATEFLRVLTRPDGSLPMFGDTSSVVLSASDPERYPPRARLELLPVAGYAVWTDLEGSAWIRSHSVLTWSHFPRHGHVVADEASLLVWSRGRPWITNIGYWPYGTAGREMATGWTGGNAPHWDGEAQDTDRTTWLRSYASDLGIVGFDLVRENADGRRLQRQVVSVDGDTWIVLDIAEAAPDGAASETLWTFMPDLVRVGGGDTGVAHLAAKTGAYAMRVTVTGMPEPTLSWHSGSYEPFAGWVVQDGRPQAAPALLVRRPAAGSWSAAIFTLEDVARPPDPQPSATLQLEAATEWEARGSSSNGEWIVRRAGTVLDVSSQAGRRQASFTVAPSTGEQRGELLDAFNKAAALYENEYRDLIFYRERFTLAVVALIVLQELTFVVWRRIERPLVPLVHLRWLALVGWLGIAGWAHFSYLT